MHERPSSINNWQQILASLREKGVIGRGEVLASEAKITWFKNDGIFKHLTSTPIILDYGSGDGTLGLLMAAKTNALELHQADTDDRRLFKDPTIPFYKIEHDQLPQTGTTQFSLILLSDVLQYVDIEKRRELIQQLLTKLAPGGKLIIQIYNDRHQVEMTDWWNKNRFSEEQIYFMTEPEKETLSTGGFTVRKKT